MITYIVSVIFLPFILIGLWVIVGAMREAWRGFRSGFWPRTTGTILRSQIKKEGTGENEKTSPDIEFQYSLNDITFQSTVIRRGLPNPPGQEFAKFFTSRYAVGQQVTIAYNPDDPKTAVLEPGLYKHAFASAARGLLCTNIGALFWLLVWTLDS